jgi:hypothetical protein
MKTDDLIAALSADAPVVARPIGRTVLACVGVGALAAAVVFFLTLGLRPDMSAAMGTPRFIFKVLLTLTLFASALGLILHLARPEKVSPGWIVALAAAPILLILATLIELLILPSDLWMPRLVGTNAMMCVVLIPFLSALPLIATLLALRQGAPTHPAFAGAVAGLLSGGIGASLYAAHCTDDSPLFIAAWYVIAIAFLTLIGAIAGSRFLRW